MIRKLLVIGTLTTLISCGGGADCSCDEIASKSDGKYYKIGAFKEGNRVKFGELFSGSCETLDENGEVLEHGEYENGIRLKHQLWAEFNGEYIQGKDLSYKNNKPFDGWSRQVDGDKKLDIKYVSYYIKYQNGDIKDEWEVEVYDNQIMLRVTREDFELDGSNHYESCNSKMPLFHAGKPVGESLVRFIKCIDKQNVEGFEYWGTLPKLSESSNSNNSSETTVESDVESEIESETVSQSIESTKDNVTLYKISDPDGYSNLRKTPGGEIIKKVYENETFEVIGEKDKHKKVKLSDGTIGYIHSSRVILN